MGFRENIRQASFRGVPFNVHGAQANFGRRTVTHEYPQRDKPYIEDLGKAAREFTIQAFVVGDDYFAKRDRLSGALEQGGPGTLVHPFYGSLNASVKSFTVTESSREGGMASFAITFFESGELQFPTQGSDTKAQVGILAEEARAQIRKDFTQRFSLVGQPDFVTDDAKAKLQRGYGAVKASIGG